jgi:hypothetical protein
MICEHIKKHYCNKIIHWVSFNLHKDPNNHYKKLLLLFKPFLGLETNSISGHILWKDVYTNQEYDIENYVIFFGI